MPRELFTTGYEGWDVDSFVANLKSHAINCLLDVRELPISRKPGFSKSGLAKRLEQEKITYVHFKELGSPKVIRKQLKRTHDYGTFFEKMDRYLADKKETIKKAYSYVVSYKCCIMCFEHLAATCHRKIVARKIKEWNGNGLRINNI